MNRNTKFKIICLVIFIFNVKLVSGQTSSEVIQAGRIKIQKETDDLISANKTLNLQLVKLQNEEVSVIKNVKDSVGYEKALLEKNRIDSIYNEKLLVQKKFKEICSLENRLDSLNRNQKITLSSTLELTVKEYQQRGYPTFKTDETLDPASYPNKKTVENLESKLKNVPSNVRLSGGKATNGIHSTYNVSFSAPFSKDNFSQYIKHNNIILNDSIQSNIESKLYAQHSKRLNSYNFVCDILKKSNVYENPETQLSEEIIEIIGGKLGKNSYVVAIKKEVYLALLSQYKNILEDNCRLSIINSVEIEDWKEKDYFLLNIYIQNLKHAQINFYNSNLSLLYPMSFECNQDNFSYNVRTLKTIKVKKLDAAIEQFSFKLLSMTDINNLIDTLGQDIKFFNRFFDYSEKLKAAQGEIDKYTSVKNNSDKTFNGLVILIQNKESDFKTKIKKITVELAWNTARIDSKERRISELEEYEKRREQYVISADKKMVEKDYAEAIIYYERALTERYLYRKLGTGVGLGDSKDVETKLTKARELYAPILAKEEQAEKQREVENEKTRQSNSSSGNKTEGALLKEYLVQLSGRISYDGYGDGENYVSGFTSNGSCYTRFNGIRGEGAYEIKRIDGNLTLRVVTNNNTYEFDAYENLYGKWEFNLENIDSGDSNLRNTIWKNQQ